MMLCFIFHIKLLPPRMFNENAANWFTHLYLLKLPWAPSCITLKPIAATTQPSKTLSEIAKKVLGVKKIRCIYTKEKTSIRITAFENILKSPVVDLPT